MKDLNQNISDRISFVLLYMWHVLHTKLHGYITYVVIKINKIYMGFFKRNGLTGAVNGMDEYYNSLDVTEISNLSVSIHVPCSLCIHQLDFYRIFVQDLNSVARTV